MSEASDANNLLAEFIVGVLRWPPAQYEQDQRL